MNSKINGNCTNKIQHHWFDFLNMLIEVLTLYKYEKNKITSTSRIDTNSFSQSVHGVFMPLN